MKRILNTLFALLITTAAFSQHYQVDTLYKNGPLDNRINVVILGDGFTAEQMPKFAEEAKKFADFFLGYDPYVRYRNYFNFFAIRTPSVESGVTNPGTAPDAYKDQPITTKNTFFGSTFGSSIHRLVTITKYDVYNDLLASHFPMYDLVIVLVNTTFYGGSGGSISVHTLHDQANKIGIHEIGHTFAHLNDEYWAGAGYGWEAANMTQESNPSLVRWKNWLKSFGIDVYVHGSGEAALWYKPANGTCLMEYLNQELCAVCTEATTETLLKQVNPVEGAEPEPGSVVSVFSPQTFRLNLLTPSPNTLQVKWSVNGAPVAGSGSQITLAPEQAPDGAVLVASVFDSTTISRYDGAKNDRTRLVEWSLKSNVPDVFRVKASADSVCAGGEVSLSAYGCRGTLSWSAGGTGSTIKVKPDKTGTYSASCQVEGSPVQKIDQQVKVMPLPAATAVNGGPYTVGATIELTAGGGKTYLWSGPMNFASTEPHVFLPDAIERHAGIYEVEVTDVNGCANHAQTIVQIDPILSIPNSSEALVTVSPNPARDYISIGTKLPGKSNVKLYDPSGREILSRSFEKKTDVKLNVPAGVYLYRFSNGGREVSGKVAVQ